MLRGCHRVHLQIHQQASTSIIGAKHSQYPFDCHTCLRSRGFMGQARQGSDQASTRVVSWPKPAEIYQQAQYYGGTQGGPIPYTARSLKKNRQHTRKNQGKSNGMVQWCAMISSGMHAY